MQKSFDHGIKRYWASKDHGLRPARPESSLEMYANEVLALIPKGGTLIDVGCGACELTTYLAPHFSWVVGIDFSHSMLAAAKQRVEQLGITNIQLVRGTATELPAAKANTVISYAVVQYMGAAEVKDHLACCRNILIDGGAVFMGLIPDVARRQLYVRRLFPGRSLTLVRILEFLKRNPIWDGIGNWFGKDEIAAWAGEAGYNATIVDSRYADYRFHALLRKV